MYIKLNGKDFTGNVFKEIASQTGKGKILIDSIKYSENDSIVEFIVKRRTIDKYKSNYFGFIKVKYKSNDFLKTKVQFKNVTLFNVDNKDKSLEEVNMLFGVKIDSNEASISSVEEVEGETVFSISIKYSSLDLTLEDIL
ncbi:hypothetical protein HZA73_02130 [candidate division TA06 bacterium]|nr:hypothetical protein [candidate division TA06 bacterium]